MSKVGNQPIIVIDAITLNIGPKTEIKIKGPQGELYYRLPKNLEATYEDKKIIIKRTKEDKKTKALHGLFRTLIQNAVIGVEKPWVKKLEILGTGYNVKIQGKELVFKLGYSHPVVFKEIIGIKYSIEGNNKVVISGVDKQLVGQVAYQIKLLKMPDPYKGKGIRYLGEQLKLKPGKKAKVGTAG